MRSPPLITDQGDVFTTTILGYNCTFIQSNEYIRSFTTATRKVLDVTAAYKLIAAPLIGEEAFFGQTKYMHQVVLSKSRIDQLHRCLWELTEELLEKKWAQSIPSHHLEGTWHKVDLAQLLDYVIFGLDVFVLIGKHMADVHLDRVSHLFRVMDSDLSLGGILLPILKGDRYYRRDAKNELLEFLKRDVETRVEQLVERAVRANSSLSPDLLSMIDDIDPADTLHDHSLPELPEILLHSELGELDDSVLLNYHRREPSALATINKKIEFIATFIYGFVWAAQTNSAAATIGLVHDILRHDQLRSEASGLAHAERIRQECASALQKDEAARSGAPVYDDMPHLIHCLNETLRLRATGAWIRLADKPFCLSPSAGSTAPRVICPAGFIVLSPMSVSLNPDVYPNPTQWDPSRYHSAPFKTLSNPEAKNDRARHIPIDPTYLLPPTSPSAPYFASWGLGQGHCPGKHLAYKMISMVVTRFFDKFDARPVGASYETAKFQDIAAAGMQRLKNGFTVMVRKRTISERIRAPSTHDHAAG